ncbi:hypothetical protein V1503_24030 [Bacillus sp. SCS-151]|uniref:hypothetical protein n=1 Tax=Nanhaiella sioensis TaxID=3115293 RepID=UPI00397E08D6
METLATVLLLIYLLLAIVHIYLEKRHHKLIKNASSLSELDSITNNKAKKLFSIITLSYGATSLTFGVIVLFIT